MEPICAIRGCPLNAKMCPGHLGTVQVLEEIPRPHLIEIGLFTIERRLRTVNRHLYKRHDGDDLGCVCENCHRAIQWARDEGYR